MSYEIVAKTLSLVAVLTIGVLIWFRVKIPPRPLELQDIASCLRHRRRANRKPIWRNARPYVAFHQGELPLEVAAQIQALEDNRMVEAVSELNFELLKQYSKYPAHVRASVYNGTWGDASRAAKKPCLLVFEFVLNGRKYELRRFMGDRKKGGPGMMPAAAHAFAWSDEPTYGFEQIEVCVDAMPMLVARRYSCRDGPYCDSVAVLESHYDDGAIRDLLSLYMFAKHSEAISSAKSSRDHRRRERARKASEKAALAAAFSSPASSG